MTGNSELIQGECYKVYSRISFRREAQERGGEKDFKNSLQSVMLALKLCLGLGLGLGFELELGWGLGLGIGGI